MSYASSATVYFAQYVMEDISLQGTLASVLYIVLLVGIILALPVMTKIGKRNTMAIGLAISAVGWFLPQITLEKTIVIAASAIEGIGFGFIAGTCGKLSAGYTYLWNLEERCDSNRNGKCSVLFCK